MSHGHSGNFRAKHPAGTKVDESILRRVAVEMAEGAIACKTAHAIAEELCAPPAEVGVAIDLQNGRIKACQLGLFGYGKVKAIARGAWQIKTQLKETVQKTAINGRISCAAAWQAARTENVSRMEIAQACEALGIKINRCQLGAF